MNLPCRWTTFQISSEANTESSVSTYGSLTSPRSLSGGGLFGWAKARGHAFLLPNRPPAEPATARRSHAALKVTPVVSCDRNLRLGLIKPRVGEWLSLPVSSCCNLTTLSFFFTQQEIVHRGECYIHTLTHTHARTHTHICVLIKCLMPYLKKEKPQFTCLLLMFCIPPPQNSIKP